MHYIVYRITCSLNGKFYIGTHATNNLNDGYMGSGVNIRRAIKELGVWNFHKEILFDFKTHTEAYNKEAELVTKELVKSELCYNLCAGGGGGRDLRLYDEFFQYIFTPNDLEVQNWVKSTEELTTRFKGSEFATVQSALIPETRKIWCVICDEVTRLYNLRSTHKRAKRWLSTIQGKNLISCLNVDQVEWSKTA
jgi:hypothetical protein